ncbi:MAG: hypothetical protein DME06_06255, partial [Candidatus Rokuibacteriota bacterium]
MLRGKCLRRKSRADDRRPWVHGTGVLEGVRPRGHGRGLPRLGSTGGGRGGAPGRGRARCGRAVRRGPHPLRRVRPDGSHGARPDPEADLRRGAHPRPGVRPSRRLPGGARRRLRHRTGPPPRGRGGRVTVLHVRVTTADDYLRRREPHRKAHIARLDGLRARGLVVGGGPAPDGRRAEIVYRAAGGARLRRLVEEDPYWRGAVWRAYAPRRFRHFVDRLAPPAVVLDGTRRLTVVEGPTRDAASAPDALLQLRDAGRV